MARQATLNGGDVNDNARSLAPPCWAGTRDPCGLHRAKLPSRGELQVVVCKCSEATARGAGARRRYQWNIHPAELAEDFP
jgi:hypothetical protein